jgi:uncharacterized protein YkwD
MSSRAAPRYVVSVSNAPQERQRQARAAASAPQRPQRTARARRASARTSSSWRAGRSSPPAGGSSPDFEALKGQMLELINDDRAAAGLALVEVDPVAARAAQAHAEEMARHGFMSHWNLAGHGPPYRYSQAGGLDAAQENVYMYWQRYDDGQPAPITDWPEVIRQAEISLMDSPGHRDNILAPEHTHVGLGLAYNADTGDMRLDQLFTNHYVQLEPLPLQMALGQPITLRGQLLPGAQKPLLNLAYEPFPQPMTVAELNQTDTYSSPAEIYDAADLEPDANGRFEKQVRLDNNGQPGLYYIRIWIEGQYGEILANEIVVEVR